MRTHIYSRHSHTNISKFHPYYLHYKSFIRDLKNCIAEFGKGRLIDIGCGNKPYEGFFQGKISEYIGCDIEQSNLQKVDILCAADNIPLEGQQFDTVFSTQTLEHVENYQGLVNEAFRLLKSDGVFILSAPLYWHLHEEPYDFFRFTMYGHESILSKAGFKIEKILPNGGMWATVGQARIHGYMNSQSKNFVISFMRTVFLKFRLCWFLNSFYAWLDKVDYNPINTMNYVVVCRKN